MRHDTFGYYTFEVSASGQALACFTGRGIILFLGVLGAARYCCRPVVVCGQGQGVEADVRRLLDDLLVKAFKTRHPTGACIVVPLGEAQITGGQVRECSRYGQLVYEVEWYIAEEFHKTLIQGRWWDDIRMCRMPASDPNEAFLS